MKKAEQPESEVPAHGADVELLAFIADKAGAVEALKKEFDAALAVASKLREQERLCTKSAEQAEAEAEAIRSRFRESIRASAPGDHLPKSIMELKGEQRSAYAVAEEFHAVAMEVRFEAEKAELYAHQIASSCKSSRAEACSVVGGRLIEVGLSKLPWEFIAGIRLKIAAEIAEPSVMVREHPDFSTRDAVLGHARKWIETAMCRTPDLGAEKIPKVLSMGINLSGFGNLSPMQRKKAMAEIEAKEAAHQQEWGA